jgi:hypothetical protein
VVALTASHFSFRDPEREVSPRLKYSNFTLFFGLVFLISAFLRRRYFSLKTAISARLF